MEAHHSGELWINLDHLGISNRRRNLVHRSFHFPLHQIKKTASVAKIEPTPSCPAAFLATAAGNWVEGGN